IIVAHPLPEESRNNVFPQQLWVESDRKIPPSDPTLEQVKIAEEASRQEEVKALETLAEVAGRTLATPRPTRKHRTFRRDEM
ncbi:MAG TPA: hypothetical protein VEB42_00660, partial [Chitinophagaceae bacterium]|nr:hypothetical protein [Chitinophagaceae bacterium]